MERSLLVLGISDGHKGCDAWYRQQQGFYLLDAHDLNSVGWLAPREIVN